MTHCRSAPLLPILLILLFALGGCASTNFEAPSIDKEMPLVKTVTTNSQTTLYTYDSSRRLKNASMSNGDLVEFSYAPGKVTRTDTVRGKTSTIVYTLDKTGMAVSDSFGTKYIYARGCLVEIDHPDGTVVIRTIGDGNVIRVQTYGAHPSDISTAYDPTTSNFIDDVFEPFLGQASRNLKWTQTSARGAEPVQYNYQIVKGLVIKMFVTGGAKYESDFTYY